MVKGGGIPELYFIRERETEQLSTPLNKGRDYELIKLLKYKQRIVGWDNEFTNADEFNKICQYILETGDKDYMEIRIKFI